MPILPFKLNQAGRHHIPRQKHKVANWAEYDASLRQRGSLTVWFTEEAIQAWVAEPRTTRGGQPWYSELAILTALTLRAVFRLALRQTEGLIGSVIRLLGLDLPVPDHTTLSRRAATLEVPRPRSGSTDAGRRAEPDGCECANPARPPPPAHRRAGQDGVAEGVRIHEAGPRRGHHRALQARDRGRAALAHGPASGDRGGRRRPGPEPHAGARTPDLRPHHLNQDRVGVTAPASLIHATQPKQWQTEPTTVIDQWPTDWRPRCWPGLW